MSLPETLLVHTVTVTPYTGVSSVGPLYGSPFDLPCMAQGKRRMVRDADGSEVLSELTLFTRPGHAALVPPGSQVEWNGDTTVVLAAIDHDSGGLGAPDHTEVVCQ